MHPIFDKLMHFFHCVLLLLLTKIAIDFFSSFLLLQGSDTGVGDLFRARKCKYYYDNKYLSDFYPNNNSYVHV